MSRVEIWVCEVRERGTGAVKVREIYPDRNPRQEAEDAARRWRDKGYTAIVWEM